MDIVTAGGHAWLIGDTGWEKWDMSIFRLGHAWDAFRDLEREMEGVLNSVNLTFQGIRIGHQYPAVNLYELPDEYLLVAKVPGTSSDDLDVTISEGVLTIKGSRPTPAEARDDRFRRHERFCGDWQRSVSIPDRVQEEQLFAEFNNGLLKIRLPKANKLKPRQIPVVEGDG